MSKITRLRRESDVLQVVLERRIYNKSSHVTSLSTVFYFTLTLRASDENSQKVLPSCYLTKKMLLLKCNPFEIYYDQDPTIT